MFVALDYEQSLLDSMPAVSRMPSSQDCSYRAVRAEVAFGGIVLRQARIGCNSTTPNTEILLGGSIDVAL